jgi:hypothetical protein
MLIIFFALTILILLHCLLLASSLLQHAPMAKAWFSWLQVGGMVLAGIIALALQSWVWLVAGFGIYCLVLAGEMAFRAWHAHRSLSPLFPVNLLMVLGAVVALTTQVWWVFVLSYAGYWLLSLVIGKRLLQTKMHSST